jgi:hypothetical protein
MMSEVEGGGDEANRGSSLLSWRILSSALSSGYVVNPRFSMAGTLAPEAAETAQNLLERLRAQLHFHGEQVGLRFVPPLTRLHAQLHPSPVAPELIPILPDHRQSATSTVP